MLDDARSLVTLSFFDELIADPMAVAAYGALFRQDDDATLVIYAPDRSESLVVPAVLRALEAAGVSAEAGPGKLLPPRPRRGGAQRAPPPRRPPRSSPRPPP